MFGLFPYFALSCTMPNPEATSARNALETARDRALATYTRCVRMLARIDLGGTTTPPKATIDAIAAEVQRAEHEAMMGGRAWLESIAAHKQAEERRLSGVVGKIRATWRLWAG